MDMLFFQDTSAIHGSAGLDGRAPARPDQGRQVHLEPVTLLAALAMVTTHLGLVATATTTYNEPFHVARRFATVDQISGGRAGWNLVTSQIEDEAGNFGLDKHVEHAARYERANEFYDVVAGLWDSWEGDAFLHDKANNTYFDPTKLHFLRHVGEHFKVRGPLNVARSPQGRPVVAQAGSSEPGRELAARTADVIFTAQNNLPAAQRFYADVKARAARYGRAPRDIKILPGVMPIVGRTRAEAQEKYDELQSLLPDELGLRELARLAGDLDIFAYPLDGPLPDLPPSNSALGRQTLVVELARRENMTIRQVARYLGSAAGHRVLIGTASDIADDMQTWLQSKGCDGFNLLFAHFPVPMIEFIDLVIPELQQRGIYRTAYTGKTLRESLDVPTPKNRFAA